MTEERSDKTVVKEKPKPKGYRAFEKLLKQVVNAPPLRHQPPQQEDVTIDRS